MNYIQRLQQTVDEQKKEIEALRGTFLEIRAYLAMPKFDAPNDFVNPKDILLRLTEGEQRANEVTL